MMFKSLFTLSMLSFAAGAFAIEQSEFDINGLKIGDKLTKEFSENYCAKKDKGKKELECKRKLDVDGIPVSVLYLFYDSSLVTVSLSFKSEMYRKLVKAYSKKLSDSTYETIEDPIILGNGSEYTNKKSLWKTSSGDFVIEKYGSNLNLGYARLNSEDYKKYINRKKRERNGSKIENIFKGIFD